MNWPLALAVVAIFSKWIFIVAAIVGLFVQLERIIRLVERQGPSSRERKEEP